MRYYLDPYRLTDNEKKKIVQLISLISNVPNTPELQQLVFSTLTARKFSIPHALELYHNYQAFSAAENLLNIDPFDEDVRRELLSGKFVILNDHDVSGVRVAQFFVRLHRKTGNHRALLQSIVFQLGAALRKETAARNGLVFIYDMTDSKYSNFDYTFSCKLFKMLRSSYPVRLRRVLILTAPLWFRASFTLMRMFIRDLFQDSVYVLRPSPGTKLHALSHPEPLALKRDHYNWLQTALVRTGWSMNDTEQANMVNGHRAKPISAFFGPPIESSTSGPISDSSDSEHREDDETDVDSVSSGSLMENDDILSLGDLDPFSLASSYSGEADNSDIESASDIVQKSVNNIDDQPYLDPDTYTVNCEVKSDKSITCGRKIESVCNSDHAGTPTPPTVAKRQQLMTDTTTTITTPSSYVSSRPKTVSTCMNNVEFVEELRLPNNIGAQTPTADSLSFRQLNDGDESDRRIKKQSESVTVTSNVISSGCSLTTTLSTSVSNRQSQRNCIQTLLDAQQSDFVSCAQSDPKTNVENSDEIMITDTDLPLADADSMDTKVMHQFSNNKTAPLAQDEIGDQTLRTHRNRFHIFPRMPGGLSSKLSASYSRPGDLPSWAIGRPQGESIHQGPDNMQPLSESFIAMPLPDGTAQINNDDIKVDTQSHHTDESTSSSFNQPTSFPNTVTSTDKENLLLDIELNMIEMSGHNSSDEDMYVTEQIDIDKDDDDDDDGDEEEEDVDDTDEDHPETIIMTEHWFTPEELLTHIQNVGLTGLINEYNAIVRLKNEYPRFAFKHVLNRSKNRYCDVICNDATRVCLRPALSCASQNPVESPLSGNCTSSVVQLCSSSRVPRASFASNSLNALVRNYIHANWVDGYRQKNAFICTQGPLSETVGDFWQMIWDYHSPIIVMITKVFEGQRSKCYHYWPDNVQHKLYFTAGQTGALNLPAKILSSNSSKGIPSGAEFQVENIKREVTDNYAHSILKLTYLPSGESRSVEHFAFFSWPDHETPQTTTGLLDLLSTVQLAYSRAVKELGYESYYEQKIPPPPITVHCSAGIGRTGTYVTVDICTKWLDDTQNKTKIINIPLTVSRVRSQRFGCVQVSAQYIFCYRAIIDFAVNTGILQNNKSVRMALSSLIQEPDPMPARFVGSNMYESASLPRPFDSSCIINPLFNPHIHTSSSVAHMTSSSTSSSTHTRNPLHDLLSFLSSGSLFKNSTKSRKLKDDLVQSFSPQPTTTVITTNTDPSEILYGSCRIKSNFNEFYNDNIPFDNETLINSTDSGTNHTLQLQVKMLQSSTASSITSSNSSVNQIPLSDHPNKPPQADQESTAKECIQAPFSRPVKPPIFDEPIFDRPLPHYEDNNKQADNNNNILTNQPTNKANNNSVIDAPANGAGSSELGQSTRLVGVVQQQLETSDSLSQCTNEPLI